SALDKDGNEIDFSKITVSGEVDTTKPGEYPITYSYEGISTTITVTVKEKKHDNESIIIVQYVDEKGNKIADDTIIRGKIGDKYETKAKKIDGYILKEEPENKNGKFVNTLTNIKYIYTNRSDATDKNKDIDTNKKIFKNEKLHSSKTYKTLPKTNEDYSVGSTILGVVILLGTTFVWFFRSKK
ncbi:bacterial Ig-like domain-containing protein, partial [Enterococcus faecalis]|nr:bacterial Ig-like domain-containing protein [Enterococcus faecalis]NSU75525.1 bacterial Ig-like domain-containing protein [Enterococcus faecalis]